MKAYMNILIKVFDEKYKDYLKKMDLVYYFGKFGYERKFIYSIIVSTFDLLDYFDTLRYDLEIDENELYEFLLKRYYDDAEREYKEELDYE